MYLVDIGSTKKFL